LGIYSETLTKEIVRSEVLYPLWETPGGA